MKRLIQLYITVRGVLDDQGGATKLTSDWQTHYGRTIGQYNKQGALHESMTD